MLADLLRVNPAASDLANDDSPYSAAICPRRAGKSYTAAELALIIGESKPGAIVIIISLNLKQLRRLYWSGSPSGLFTIDRCWKLGLSYNNSMLRWEHENGSIGYLMGAEDDDQLEVLRGMEADLYIVDECKSFPPTRLRKLLNDIIEPQRATRQGRVVLVGTPGNITSGPFYEATCPGVHDSDGLPFSVPFGEKDPHGRTPKKHRIWSRHHWTLEANSAKPHQWEDALITKAKNKWADNDPTWRREYLGEWAMGGRGLVYDYSERRGKGDVTWVPNPTDKDPHGLPAEGAPWRFIGGMDLGFQEPTALVIGAYSAKLRQLRHVYDVSRSHLVVDDVIDLLHETFARFGQIEKIYVDGGGLGKMVLETLARHGFPVERAEKREKWDHIELVNSAFARGEVQIVPGTELEHQLLTNAWRIEDDANAEEEFALLARTGRLREDDAIPNDLADAFLYLYRGSLHQFGHTEAPPEPEYGTVEWVQRMEREALRKMRRSLADQVVSRIANSLPRAPRFIQRALLKGQRWSPPTSSTRS